MSWQPESRERQSAKRKEIGHVSRQRLSTTVILFIFNSWERHYHCASFGVIAIVARACSLIFFSAASCLGKPWRPRRKVKAKKNQSRLNNRVGLPSIPHFLFYFFFPPNFLSFSCQFPQLHFQPVSSVINIFLNFTAADDNGDMFKPPNLDDDDFSPFGGKGGLFSGGRGLFDDDDDDDDEVCHVSLAPLATSFQKKPDVCLPLSGRSVLRGAETSCG